MTKTRLLVVDDEPGMRRTLARIMKAKGFEVHVAEDGLSAIELARKFQPDVMLLDIRMPGIDGVETWRQMKLICPNAFAIFMTAFASSQRTEDAKTEGALEVFAKPVDIDAICRLIRKAIRPVLIVDDDQGFRESMDLALTKLSFDVTTAETADEAINHFTEHPRGIVLLDMKLNGKSGLDVLKQIRDSKYDVLIMLMTGFAEFEDDMQTGMDPGAACSFTKPFEIDDLVQEIRRRTESGHAV